MHDDHALVRHTHGIRPGPSSSSVGSGRRQHGSILARGQHAPKKQRERENIQMIIYKCSDLIKGCLMLGGETSMLWTRVEELRNGLLIHLNSFTSLFLFFLVFSWLDFHCWISPSATRVLPVLPMYFELSDTAGRHFGNDCVLCFLTF